MSETTPNHDQKPAISQAQANLAELRQVAKRERAALTPLLAQVGDACRAEVPLLAGDVHDLAGLAEIEGHLFVSDPDGG